MSIERLTEVCELQKERVTDALKTIDNDHAYIHAGKYFTYALHFDLLTTATSKITIVTPSSKYVHLRPANVISSADKLSMNVYEGSTGNSGGSAVTPVNRNRNSTVSATAVLKTGVTVTSNGTKITEAYIAGSTGVGQNRSGSALAPSNEWVLKPSTVYTYEFINGSSNTNTVFVEFQWYEEDNA